MLAHALVLAATASGPDRISLRDPVLVVENPWLVKVAAQRNLPAAVLCTHGNPSTAPTEAVAALRVAGAQLRYHAGFGERARETDPEQSRNRAPGRLNQRRSLRREGDPHQAGQTRQLISRVSS